MNYSKEVVDLNLNHGFLEISSNLSSGIWKEDLGFVEMTSMKGKGSWNGTTIVLDHPNATPGTVYLFPEEAAYVC